MELYSAASDRFRVPAPQDEDWRFTPIDPFVRALPAADPPARTPAQAEKLALCPLSGPLAVFVDGHHAPALSSGQADFLRVEKGGAVIRLPERFIPKDPVHLLFISTASQPSRAAYPRVSVKAERGSRAVILEDYVGAGAGPCLTSAVTEIDLKDGAQLEHYRFQRESEEAVHAAGLRVRLGKDSIFTSHSVSLGARLARNDIRVLLEGEGADATLNGLYLVSGRQHVDYHTVIDHARPHGSSRELYKGVLDGAARAVFDGSVVVRPDAQKTNAQVYNKNLLLSESGLVNTKPEFKINANDVQCRHGATIGQISGDALFYLRSRGIGLEPARRLMVHAFASEMIERMGLEPARTALSQLLHARLPED